MRPSHATFAMIFGTVYTGLATNLLVVVAVSPLLAALAGGAEAWPAVLLTAPLAAPATSAAFAVFAAFSGEGSTAVVRTYVRAWWAMLGRGLLVGTTATGGLLVVVVDVAAVWGQRVGAVAIPVLVVLGVVVVVTTVLVLARMAGPGRVGLRRTVGPALFLGVRSWPLSLLSLACLALLWTAAGMQPVLALGLGLAPALYVVWVNSTRTWQVIPGIGAAAPQPSPPST